MPEVADDTGVYDDHVINSKNSVLYHEKILEAIVERKRDRAAQILEEHLKEVGKRLQSFMDYPSLPFL